jgi:hypothetical protein
MYRGHTGNKLQSYGKSGTETSTAMHYINEILFKLAIHMVNISQRVPTTHIKHILIHLV